MVLFSKSYSDPVGQKVPYIHEMEKCCQREFTLYGQTIAGSSRTDPSSELNSGAQGRERQRGLTL